MPYNVFFTVQPNKFYRTIFATNLKTDTSEWYLHCHWKKSPLTLVALMAVRGFAPLYSNTWESHRPTFPIVVFELNYRKMADRSVHRFQKEFLEKEHKQLFVDSVTQNHPLNPQTQNTVKLVGCFVGKKDPITNCGFFLVLFFFFCVFYLHYLICITDVNPKCFLSCFWLNKYD